MELVKLRITLDFVQDQTDLTWGEILFGIDNELLEPGAAVGLAAKQLDLSEHPSPALVELAGLSAGEPTLGLVEELAASEVEQEEEKIRDKWLYLVMAWVFEHLENFPEPLRVVEEIYADFGYPESITQIVRYMPSDELDLGSKEANEGRLFEKWEQYLESASRTAGKSK